MLDGESSQVEDDSQPSLRLELKSCFGRVWHLPTPPDQVFWAARICLLVEELQLLEQHRSGPDHHRVTGRHRSSHGVLESGRNPCPASLPVCNTPLPLPPS